MKNSDQPANPVPHQNMDGPIQYDMDGPIQDDVYTGLTKREYAAIAAMQGYLASHAGAVAQVLAKRSIAYADALLAELEKQKEQ